MVGLQSLAPGQAPMPGQGQMAGQPAMPGMLPKPQGVQQAPTRAGLAAFVPTLKNKSLEELIGLLNSPQKQYPADAIISAMAEQQKDMAADEANKRQLAMMQARQQPTGTVADQIKQGALHALMQKQGATQMAAHGGVMRGYAGGGAVAFQEGGRTFGYAPDYELARKYGISLSPYDSPSVREEKIKRARAMAGFEEQSKSFGEIPVDRSKLFPFGVPESPMMPVPEIQIRPSAPSAPARTNTAGPRPTGGQRQAQRPATNMDVGALMSPVEVTGTAAPAGAGLAALEAADVEAAQKRLTQDPEVKAAQEALLKRMQTTEESRRSRAQQQLDEVLKRGRTSVFEDPEALLRIAAGIDTRKGKGIGSLAGGVSGVMGERRKEAADARTLFNKEMDALSTMEQLRLERDLLIKQGRITEAQAAEDKLRAVRKEYEGIRYDREVKQREEERQQFVAQSGRMSAEASVRQADAAVRRAAAAGTEKPVTPYQLAQLRDKARDNLKDTLPMIVREAKRKAQAAGMPFDPQAAETEAIEREMERLMPGLSGKKPAPAPAAGATMPPGNWGKAQVVTP